MSNLIPPMTNPLGQYWDQPYVEDVLIDTDCALVSEADFQLLKDYSLSQPTGLYVGKMWKGRYKAGWFLLWVDVDEQGDPSMVTIRNRKLLVV